MENIGQFFLSFKTNVLKATSQGVMATQCRAIFEIIHRFDIHNTSVVYRSNTFL